MYFNIKAIISLNFYITYILLSASAPELFNRAKKRLRSIICSTEPSKNPWRRPTFPHEDMQYHRR